MTKYKIKYINTTDGKRYIILRDYGGGDWNSVRNSKYYKTKKGAMKEIKRRKRLDI